MNWNNPDAYPGETEQEYEIRKRGESQAATGLMSGIIKFFFSALQIAAIFQRVLLRRVLLSSQKLWGEETDNIKIWGFSLLFTYLIFCIVYF